MVKQWKICEKELIYYLWKIIDEVVGLKLKMYSMKNIYGKESNTAKGDNIATNFNELKDTLFNKKNT